MADDHHLNRVVGNDDGHEPPKVMVYRTGTEGGVSAGVEGPPDRRILTADVWHADGVMAGDRNVQKNVSYLRLDEPRVTCESAVVGAASMRAFYALTENPDSSLRRMAFRRALTRQDGQDLVARQGVVCGTVHGPARVMSYSVRVRSSRGVIVGDRNVQTNRFNYMLKAPTLSIHEIAACHPKVASMVVRLVAQPDDERRIRALGREIDRAVHGIGDRLWFAQAVQAAPGLGCCAGVVIGCNNRQINTSEVKVRSVDVDRVIETLNEQAFDAAEIRRLDAEYARLVALLDGPASDITADLAAIGQEAVTNREQYLEIQERRLARFDDEAVITHGDRVEVARLLGAARLAVADLTERVGVWIADANDPTSVSEPSKSILLRIAEALGLIRPGEPHADASTLGTIDLTTTPPRPDGFVSSAQGEPEQPAEASGLDVLGLPILGEPGEVTFPDGPSLSNAWSDALPPVAEQAFSLTWVVDAADGLEPADPWTSSTLPSWSVVMPPTLADLTRPDDIDIAGPDGIDGIDGIGGF
ncbi:hypothetical protein MXD63_11115 [Frankia sp. Cpl3]|nr:hypothetical protein [Frankia sp. Cpl3]